MELTGAERSKSNQWQPPNRLILRSEEALASYFQKRRLRFLMRRQLLEEGVAKQANTAAVEQGQSRRSLGGGVATGVLRLKQAAARVNFVADRQAGSGRLTLRRRHAEPSDAADWSKAAGHVCSPTEAVSPPPEWSEAEKVGTAASAKPRPVELGASDVSCAQQDALVVSAGFNDSSNDQKEKAIPEAAPLSPAVKLGTSSGQRPPSSNGLRLRRKKDSALESRRDAALTSVEKPVCCNCRAPFALTDEFPPLSRIDCPRCGTRQVVPARIEHFLLETQLGSGGMGVTYRAFDETLHRNVAIKLISAELAGCRRNVEAMIREARRAAGVVHPNIVPIHSIGSVDGTPYIVMELLSDSQLARPVAKQMKLEERSVLETGMGVAKGLAATFELGILHLDIKPANILHDRFGVAKLIDFGLACALEEDWASGLGTCLYMAPERIRRDGQDFRCDQYSLGISLWQALAGKAPFEAPDLDQLASAILRNAPEYLHLLRPDIHLWTSGLIHKMTSYDPQDRYQSYSELIAAFDMVLDALRTGAPIQPPDA